MSACKFNDNASNNHTFSDLDNYYWGVPVYTPSRECSSLGGLCVQENDCERGQLTQTSGLCEDRGIGVECCYKGKYIVDFEKSSKFLTNVFNWIFSGSTGGAVQSIWRCLHVQLYNSTTSIACQRLWRPILLHSSLNNTNKTGRPDPLLAAARRSFITFWFQYFCVVFKF